MEGGAMLGGAAMVAWATLGWGKARDNGGLMVRAWDTGVTWGTAADMEGMEEATRVGGAAAAILAEASVVLAATWPFNLLAPNVVTLSKRKSFVALKSEFSFLRALISFCMFSIFLRMTVISMPRRSHSGMGSLSL